jgi:hypothetical protein
METPRADLDALIRAAIEQKRLVELVYGNKRRILEPHDGINKGTIKLLGYQVAGASRRRLPNWRWLEVKSCRNIL